MLLSAFVRRKVYIHFERAAHVRAALLKAAESLKEVSAAPEYTKYEYFYTFTS